MRAVPVYAGPFGKEQAERLYWRAGYGSGAFGRSQLLR
jgi:hypothetical protein